MTRHLPYDLLAAATVAVAGAAVIWTADTAPRTDDAGAVVRIAETWSLRSPEMIDSAERRTVRVVYQPLVQGR